MGRRQVLVVGGTGFIGVHVVRALDAAGHAVTVYHRGRHEPDLPPGVRHSRSEEAGIPVLRYPDALRRAPFDAVVLMVPLGDADARAAVDAFRGRAGRLVAVSSGDVYAAYGQLLGTEPVSGTPDSSAPESDLLDEDAPLRRAPYPYGRSAPSPWGGELVDYDKILVERAVLGAAELPGTVLRLPAVYGPGDRQHRFAPYVRRMTDRRPFVLLGDAHARWRCTHGYVENVAAAVALAALHPAAAGRVYNVGESDTPTVAERVRAVGVAAGWTGAVVTVAEARVPAHLRQPVNYAVHLATDTRRIRRELGYAEPVAIDEALRRTVAWERTNSPHADAAGPDYAAEYAAEDAAVHPASTAGG